MLENSQVSEGKLRLLHYANCCTKSEASLRDAKKRRLWWEAGCRWNPSFPVWSIAGWSRKGYSAEKIQKDIYPSLGLAEIYDALRLPQPQRRDRSAARRKFTVCSRSPQTTSPMAAVSLFIDEDVHEGLAAALRRQGIDAVNAHECGRKKQKMSNNWDLLFRQTGVNDF